MRLSRPMAAALLLLCAGLPAAAQEPPAPANDTELRARIERAGGSADNDRADRVVVMRRTTVDVEDSGLAHIRERQVVKCLTEAGAAQLARLRFDYDPTSNVVEIRSMRVLRKDGSVEPIAPAAVADLPQPQQAIYWGARMKLVPVPRLAVGDAIDVETYTKGFLIAYLDQPGSAGASGAGAGAAEGDEKYIPPMRGHFYDVVRFQDSAPVKERHYTVTTPRDKPVQFEVYNGEVKSFVGFDKDRLVYRFWKENMPPFRAEPRAPAEDDLAPKVVLATVQDWEDKSSWFAQVNEGQYEATDAIRAKVDELTRGAKTDDEKIAAIVHWTADNIRYSGVTMGKGEGYTLHPAPMIFEDRSGVCKDKAGLAIAMLRAAGFTVYPAMTMAGARVERIPADQFNHCVTALKKNDGTYQLLDPTWVPLSTELWSSAEGEQHFLVGTPEGKTLETTPAFDPAANGFTVRATSRLDEQGTLSGTLVIEGRGVADQRLRRELVAGFAAHDRQAWFERLVGTFAPGAEVEKVALTREQLLDVTKPVRLEVRYKVAGYAMLSGRTLAFVPPGLRHPLRGGTFGPYLDMAGAETRRFALEMGVPRQMDVQETLVLPAKYKVTRLPRERKLDGPAAAFAAKTTATGGTLKTEYRLTVKRRIVPAADYINFRDVIREAKDADADVVLLEREGQ